MSKEDPVGGGAAPIARSRRTTGRRAGTTAGAGAWAIAILAALPSQAAGPRFQECLVERKHDEALFADLDGDRLQDLVLIDASELAVFFQDPVRGFGPTPWA